MPVTRTEALFFTAGVAVGAAAAANYPWLKKKAGPLIAGVGTAFGDSYAEAARRVAEKVEAVQDAMAEMRRAAPGEGPGTTEAPSA